MLSAYPEINAVLLLIVGLITASVLSQLAKRLSRWVESKMDELFPKLDVSKAPSSKLVQRTVYYITLIVFVLLALRTLGVEETSGLFDDLIRLIPGFISGLVIVIVGYVISIAVYHGLMGYLGSTNNAIPRIAQIMVITIAALTGLAQMAINVSLISQTLIVILVVSLGGLSLAFGFGARDYVANLLASRELTRYSIGDTIRVLGIEGTVVEITRSGMVLQTADGLATIPGRLVAENVVTRITHSQ